MRKSVYLFILLHVSNYRHVYTWNLLHARSITIRLIRSSVIVNSSVESRAHCNPAQPDFACVCITTSTCEMRDLNGFSPCQTEHQRQLRLASPSLPFVRLRRLPTSHYHFCLTGTQSKVERCELCANGLLSLHLSNLFNAISFPSENVKIPEGRTFDAFRIGRNRIFIAFTE